MTDQPTSGPWTVRQAYTWCEILGPNGEVLARVLGGKVEEGQVPEFYPMELNAQLMASAPNMLAALRLMVDHFGDPLKVARAAIAKAECR